MELNLSRLSEYPLISVDCETTGLHWYEHETFGVAIAAWNGERMASAYYDIRERPSIVAALKDQLPKVRRLVNHNMKFDTHFLLNLGIEVPFDRLECTSVRAALIDEHELSFSLDALGLKYVGQGKAVGVYEELAQMFGGKPTREAQMKNLHRAPAKLAAKYATPDPEIAIKLWLWQEEEIKRQELGQVWDLERRLMPVLIDMEREGVRANEELTRKSLIKMGTLIAKNQRSLEKAVGRSFNANSPPQVKALFNPEKREDGRWWVGTTQLETTETGGPSVGAEALRDLEEKGNEYAGLILAVRKSSKARQFLEKHILGHLVGDRVYPNYNQTRGDNELGTGTGRFSIDDPALQQIPSRDVDIASIVRACFIPDNKSKWVCGDWEQFEFRWFAHYAKTPSLLQAYKDDPTKDFHQMVADLTGIPRKPRFAGDANAKQINLGLVFGMGQGKMAAEMGLPYTVERRGGKEWLAPGPEAVEVFERYHAAVPGVKALLEQASSIARSRGYVQTAMGRHIRFPGGKFTHKAGGLVFQGTSADCMKQKMVELHPISKREGFKMLLSVHDELDFSVPDEVVVPTMTAMKKVLETFDGEQCPIHCRVPILSSMAAGPNWWEASK